MRVLIVDDETEFVNMLKERLSYKNVLIDFAYDGKLALELIKANDYDIVFLDQNMPEMTGLEVARYIKDNNIKTKTVMITGYAGMAGTLAQMVGIEEYLTKPIALKDVENIIEKYR
jgi:CheY-like chemotaxis protein